MLRTVRIAISWFILIGAPALVLGSLTAVALNWVVACAVVILWMIAWIMLSLTAEEQVVRFFGARAAGNRPHYRRRDQALARRLYSLKLAHTPRLLIIESPEPQLWIARSAFSDGAIFVSEGLIGLLDEVELTAWLSLAAEEVRRPELVLETVACAAANSARRWTPGAWTRFLIYGELRAMATPARDFGVLSTLWALMMLQITRFFLSVAQAGNLSWVNLQRQLRRAAQKDAFCFFPLSVYQEHFISEKNRHNLFLQEKLS